MLQTYFQTLARYNRWANARLLDALRPIAETPDGWALMKQPLGLPMDTIWGTLNHGLVADRIWLHRVTNEGPTHDRLDAEAAADLPAYETARAGEDERILDTVGRIEGLETRVVAYHRMTGQAMATPLRFIIAHIFNHATHHRSQVFTALRQQGTVVEPLDLPIYLQAEEPVESPSL